MVSQMTDHMQAPPIAQPLRRRSNTLKARTLALALCSSALNHAPALGQGFDGTPTVVSGSASITGSGSTTFVDVSSPEVVIDWSVNNSGTSHEFQAAGSTTDYSAMSVPFSDFIVLNRIIPQNGNATMVMDGSITSSINGGAGGQLWFYTPGGFLIGQNANISVGSLVLTSSDIDQTGGLLGGSGEIRFTGSPSNSSIVIENGAQIFASNDSGSSYVAMLAPRIVQGGTINVNGSTALIAAEQADLRFSAGLFDVSVTVGSEDGNGIVHTGTTTGAASDGLADVQRIAMVAVPKNDAMTMLLGGAIGYAPAAVASEDGSAVMLSAGYDLSEGAPSTLASGAPANISINGAVFTSRVGDFDSPARASGTISIGGTGSVDFDRSAYLRGDAALNVTANAGQTISFDEDSILTASSGMSGGTLTLLAGPADNTIPAGEIIAAGILMLDASGNQFLTSGTPTTANATGGTISLTAQGGEISADSLDIVASASGFELANVGGSGTGGSITVSALAGGTIDAGFMSADVGATGGDGDLGGGNGSGGSINISEQNGTLALGDLRLFATATGGSSATGTAGSIALTLNTSTMALDGLFATAEAYGGQALTTDGLSGAAIGNADAVTITVGGTSSLTVNGDVFISADANGYDNVAAGTQVRGGGIEILVNDDGYLRFENNARFTADATTRSSTPGDFGNFSPVTQGGSVTLRTAGGTFEAPGLTLSANAYGVGANVSAGTATGGTVHLDVADGTLNLNGGGFGPALLLEAIGAGGTGPVASAGQGGTARLTVSGGEIQVGGDLVVDAGGRFAQSGNSDELAGATTNRGGTAIFEALGNSNGNLIFGTLEILAEGDGRLLDDAGGIVARNGNGSMGIGGNASLVLQSGSIENQAIRLSSDGYGGAAPRSADSALVAGEGQGGSSLLHLSGGMIGTSELSITAIGWGGTEAGSAFDEPLAAIGGAGTGGTAGLLLDGGNLFTGSSITIIVADGVGGDGGAGEDFDGGAGGAGSGGTAYLTASGLAFLSASEFSVRAAGSGGAGGASNLGTAGAGGSGAGGNARMTLGDAGFSTGAINVDASATGGAGSTGGNAAGGSVSFDMTDAAILNDPSLADGLIREVTTLALLASGNGGTGDAGNGTSRGGSGSVTVRSGPAAAPALSGSLIVDLSGDLPPASGQGFSLSTGNSAFTIGDSLEITTAGPINLAAGAGAPIVVSSDLIVSTTGTVTGTGDVQVAGNSSVDASSGIALDVLRVAGDADFFAPDGAITVSGDLDVGGSVRASGRSVALTALGSLDLETIIANSGAISVTTGQDVTFTQQISATGAITVNSAGTVTVQAPMVGSAVTLGGANVSTIGDAPLRSTSGDIVITAANNASLGYTVDAAGTLRVGAGGLAQFDADVLGNDIAVQATDIGIGAGVNLGSLARTKSIALTFTQSPTALVLGGNDANSRGLTADEIGRIFAQQSVDILSGSSSQDVLLQSFSLDSTSGGTIGSTGRFGITGYGRMTISGAIDFTTGGSASTLELGANDIVLLTETGAITLRNGTDTPQGQLLFTANRLLVGTSDALTAINGLTDLGAIADILHTPPAGGTPGDAIIAGHIGATVRDALFIQNSGATDAFEDRRGFLADSFAITNGSSQPVAISINGRLRTPAGAYLTGFDVASAITQNRAPLGLAAGAYRPFSTVNGCVIGQTCGGSVSLVPTRETFTPEALLLTPALLEMTQPAITFGDMPLFETTPLVDEPVTGVGNEDLWDADKS
jgi:hypothetical protein